MKQKYKNKYEPKYSEKYSSKDKGTIPDKKIQIVKRSS